MRLLNVSLVLGLVAFTVSVQGLSQVRPSEHGLEPKSTPHRMLDSNLDILPTKPPTPAPMLNHSHHKVESFRCDYFDGYPSVCSNTSNRCQYCCASGRCLETVASTGQTLGDLSLEPIPGYHVYPGNVTCPNAAVLPSKSLNCDVTCNVLEQAEAAMMKDGQTEKDITASSLCTDCLARPWCLHCDQAPHPGEACLHRDSALCPKTMVDTCVPLPPPDDETVVDKIIPWVVLFCICGGLLVIIIPVCRWIYGVIKGKLNQRRDARRRREFREREERRAREERERRERADAISTTATVGTATTAATAAIPEPRSTTTTATNGTAAATTAGSPIESSTELSEQHPLLQSNGSSPTSNGAAETSETSAGREAESPSPNAAKATTVEVAGPPPSAPSSKSSFDDEDACQLCLDARASIVYYPCYHSYCCEDCSSKLRPSGNRREGHAIVCPFCRQRVRAIVSMDPLPDTIKDSLRKRK